MSTVVRTQSPARSLVESAVQNGWEPHFVVAYGDIVQALEALGRMLDIPVELF